jgi:actin-like ATPase involved in cell morphogenesis
MDRRLSDETGLAVTLVESPLTTVALGAGAALDELESLRRTEPEARRGRRGRFGRR